MMAYGYERTLEQKAADGRARRNTPSGRPVRVPDVETLPCTPETLHALTNRMAGRSRVETYCTGCGETWVELDRQIREELRWSRSQS